MSAGLLDAPAALGSADDPSPGDVLVDVLAAQLPRLSGGRRCFIDGVSWAAYQRLVAARDALRGSVRVTFDRGELEAMTTTSVHERWKHLLDRVIGAYGDHVQVIADPVGHMSLDRAELDRGADPDLGYYIANLPHVPLDDPVDINVNPVPDLAVEIEYTRTVVNRLPVFAAMGLPEIWVYNGDRLRVLLLTLAGEYEESAVSRCFPTFPFDLAAELLPTVRHTPVPTVVKQFRDRLAAL